MDGRYSVTALEEQTDGRTDVIELEVQTENLQVHLEIAKIYNKNRFTKDFTSTAIDRSGLLQNSNPILGLYCQIKKIMCIDYFLQMSQTLIQFSFVVRSFSVL